MPISMSHKPVYTTTDGHTHNTRLDAHRHEARTTLEQLGVQGDHALKILASKPNVLRGIAEALNDFASQSEAIAKGTADDVPDLDTGKWPDDANVAPRKGDEPRELRGSKKAGEDEAAKNEAGAGRETVSPKDSDHGQTGGKEGGHGRTNVGKN